MKAVLKNPNLLLPPDPNQLGPHIPGSAFSIRDDRGALDLAISLAQGSVTETQLLCFPGQQGFRNSTATQHGAAIYKSCKHIMYAAALFQEQASNSTQSHQSLLASSHTGPAPTPPDHSEKADASIP